MGAMQPFPHPIDASDKNWLKKGLLVAEIFMFESVNGRTDGHTDAGSTGIL